VSVLTMWAVDEPAPALKQLRKIGVVPDTMCHGLPLIADKVACIVQKIRRDHIRVVVACQDTSIAYQVFQQVSPDECQLVEHAGIVGEVDRIPKDRTARIVGVSGAIAARAASLLPDRDRARYLPSLVDVAEFEREDRAFLRQGLAFDQDVVVTFVGRLDAKKGIEHLIDAAAVLLPRHERLRFVVVGGVDAHQPDTAARLMCHARDACDRHEGRFVFAGARSDVARLLVASDICVLPARGEGMSHVINEAGAAGLAVVAADDGAAREQLENGGAGMLVPYGDRTALANAIEGLVLDPALRARLGARLKVRVHREYAVSRVLPRWEALLKEVVASTRPVPSRLAMRQPHDDTLLPFPLEIQIETNTACNATCIMCPYPEVSKELPPGRMDRGLYEHILAQCAAEPTLWRIEPFLNNEPFTDTRMVDFIALTKRTVPHAWVSVTTNGSLVTPKISDRLIHSGLDGIWFSFNGSTKETYEQIMGISFDKVKANIDYLLDVKPPSLRVFTNMIETVPMRGEIADNIRYWQSRGVESGASPLVNRAGNVRNFDDLNYQRVHADPIRICDLLFHKMYIGCNGDVLLCCMDWRRRVVLGNAGRQTLREIWHGEPYQHYRRLHVEGRSRELELCKDCSYVHT
jgi:radical SAM protein with 4Fe4S-binding SPASM domain